MNKARVERVSRKGKNGQDYEVLCLFLEASNGKWILIQEIYINDAMKSVLDFIQN